jgi:nicotinamidase-related amidase
MTNSHLLFDVKRSCLVVIDVQQYFLKKLPIDQRGSLVARIVWLVRLAVALDIPIIATAEDIGTNGGLIAEVMSVLPRAQIVFDKMVFGLCGQADILEAVRKTERDEFILIGLETDVCICHSAIGMREEGYRVAAVSDASASPAPHHEAGILRMRQAGVTITNTKGIYYEWVRNIASLERVKALRHNLPPDMTL